MGNDMVSKGRVTIREVAERAGVSTATASRALSGNHPVPAATRARVLRAARDLDYVANAHARALVGGGRKMAAVVVRQVTSPFYAQVAEGVEAEAADRGWLCVVGATGGDAQREMEFVQLMREEGARLVILVGGVVEDDAYRERVAHYAHALDSSGARLVLCGRPAPDPEIPALVVEFDNEAGARAVTAHLLSAGHRGIVFLGGLPGNTALDARVAELPGRPRRARAAARGRPRRRLRTRPRRRTPGHDRTPQADTGVHRRLHAATTWSPPVPCARSPTAG